MTRGFVYARTSMCDVTVCNMPDSYVICCIPTSIPPCNITQIFCATGLVCVTWLIHTCRDAFVCVTWLIYTCCDACVGLTWLVHATGALLVYLCDMVRRFVWYDTDICVTTCCNIYVPPYTRISMYTYTCTYTRTRTRTHTHTHTHTHKHTQTHTFAWQEWFIGYLTCSSVWHDSSMCVTWLKHLKWQIHTWRNLFWTGNESFMCQARIDDVCDMTPSCATHDAFICVVWGRGGGRDREGE